MSSPPKKITVLISFSQGDKIKVPKNNPTMYDVRKRKLHFSL